jgi:CRISPR-associated endonuclease/helicase Cas3
MSYSFKLQSHPQKLLKDHIMNVYQNGHLFYSNIVLNDSYQQVLDLILLLHDIGKASSYFQKYIQTVEQVEKEEISQEDLAQVKYDLGKHRNHARISAVWVFIAISQKMQDEKNALIGFLAVLKHHGHLGNLEDMLSFKGNDIQVLKDISQSLDYYEFQKILELNGYSVEEFNHDNLTKYLDEFFSTRQYRRVWKKEIQKALTSETFFKTSLAFSILLSADKGECIFDGVVYQRKNKSLSAQLVDRYKSKKFGVPKSKLNQLRNQVYDSASRNAGKLTGDDRFLSINVPTGIGKTLTALNVVLKLKAANKSMDKIIYCLPFTSIIDQNADVINEILEMNGVESNSENLLINHHLSELTYEPKTDEGEIDDKRAEYLVRQFESNINVTTFYQLLHGILTGRNREIRKLQSFANSIIILDEVQSIPSKYWPLVKKVFQKLADRLNIIFILVTATLPMIFSEERGEITELIDGKESIFQSLDRIKLDTSLLKEDITKAEFTDILKRDIYSNRDKSFLIILNTIEASKDIYRKLNEDDSLNLKYLSTNITPKERLNRIKEIKNCKKPLIVVSTQLVEAGVDIDLDVVYRDLAPMDSIFQSAGRCNRNDGNQKGIVKIFSLLDGDRRYASYIYGGADLTLTRDLLNEKDLFKECEFYDLSKTYYRKIVKNTDESNFILDEMDKLNYSNAFDPKESKSAFQLIEELPTYPAYVAFEDEAKCLLQEYKELIDTKFDNIFDKKRKVNNHLKKMSQYMVSVPEKYAYDRDNLNDFFYLISEEQVDFSYDKETGIEFESGMLSI